MTKKQFEIVKSQYIDAAGLFESEEFDRVAYIYRLSGRINTVNVYIDLQERFIAEFGMPCLIKIDFLKKFGHHIKWENDLDKFRKAIESVQNREKKYISQLEAKVHELTDLRKSKGDGKQPSIKQSRKQFIQQRIALGKAGYQIDIDVTTIEELSFMIKQQLEEVEAINNRQNG